MKGMAIKIDQAENELSRDFIRVETQKALDSYDKGVKGIKSNEVYKKMDKKYGITSHL
jgi:hypothetical protein